jgi:hypothetical protein
LTQAGQSTHHEPVIAATLTERLTCAACGYDLRGLSVLDRCPECGLRISTSILAVIDPRAQEFEPIRRPRMVALGLLVWSLCGLLAALCAWTLRASELPTLNNSPHLIGDTGVRALAAVGACCIVVSGGGAVALVKPARRMPPMGSRLTMMGVALYLPLAAAFWVLHGQVDVSLASPYFGRMPDGERVILRAMELGLIAAIVLLLRTNARTLAARSAILRTGRVDRQTMYAVAVAAALGVLGDVIRLLATHADGTPSQVLSIAGVSIVAIASLLLTLGIAGVCIDCARIARALLRSGRRLTSLMSMVDVARAERQTDTAP